MCCVSFDAEVTSAPSDLDTTLPTGLTRLGLAGPRPGHAVARQADGKMVVVGRPGHFTSVEALRYNTDGSLDTTFADSAPARHRFNWARLGAGQAGENSDGRQDSHRSQCLRRLSGSPLILAWCDSSPTHA